MSNNESNSQFNIREYAEGSVDNRNHFEGLDFAQTLQGKREAYQSYFLHTDQLAQYADAQFAIINKRSVKGYKGTVAAECHKADVDVKDDLSKALEVTRQLVSRLINDYKVPATSLHVKFSGSKGFHIMLAEELFGGFTPSSNLPAVHKTIANELYQGYEHHIDTSIYHTTALFRIENTQNSKSGLYSIPLTVDELTSLSIDKIEELADKPRIISAESIPYSPVDSLVKLKQKCELQVTSRVVEQRAAHPTSPVQDNTNTPQPDA
jgi:hypothetical protein